MLRRHLRLCTALLPLSLLAAPLYAQDETTSPPPAPTQEVVAEPPAPVSAPVIALNDVVKERLDALLRDAQRNPVLKREREQLLSFYAARNFAPLWLENGAWSDKARGAHARLEKADEDALTITANLIPKLREPMNERVEDEIALSLAAITYARQASGSRVDPKLVHKDITEKPKIPDIATILGALADKSDGDAALQDFNPPHADYKALRAELSKLRAAPARAGLRLSYGPVIKPGMKDARVPLLRKHFGLETTGDALIYDEALVDAVKQLQTQHGQSALGEIGPRTLAALSVSSKDTINDVMANMERWRWRSRHISDHRIEVNVPDYQLRLIEGGAEIHRARVIVGAVKTPTPIFSNKMQFIEVNPYWNVPDSIVEQEMLPKLKEDPDYLKKLGYEVQEWRGKLHVRQPPGERNALGHIKFMFPNQHAVYLHDTPTRHLFSTPVRAYSHGCVRLDQPFRFAEIILGKENGWSEQKVRSLIGGKNETIPLPKHIDIHIGYFTTFMDQDGKLNLRDDIYGHSRRVRILLGLESGPLT